MTVPFVYNFRFSEVQFFIFHSPVIEKTQASLEWPNRYKFYSDAQKTIFRDRSICVVAMLRPPVTVCVLCFSGPYSPLCPVLMFYRMCELIPAPDASPVFVLSSLLGRLRPVLRVSLFLFFVLGCALRIFFRPICFGVTPFVGEGHLRPQSRWVFLGNLPRSSGIGAQTRINVIQISLCPLSCRFPRASLLIFLLVQPAQTLVVWLVCRAERLLLCCRLVCLLKAVSLTIESVSIDNEYEYEKESISYSYSLSFL